VEKEMYIFEDLDGTKVALRPEATASLARAYIQHGLWNQPQPIKAWYWGPMFRHERPQSGRYRNFYQFGFEILNEAAPIADAIIILLAYNFYHEMGVPVSIQINSIGCAECRAKYVEELTQYFRSQRSHLCEFCKKRLQRNPLRLLDCKEEQCQPVKQNAPQILDSLCDSCREHFMAVL
jgi:histidyl-tRNA synthetase